MTGKVARTKLGDSMNKNRHWRDFVPNFWALASLTIVHVAFAEYPLSLVGSNAVLRKNMRIVNINGILRNFGLQRLTSVLLSRSFVFLCAFLFSLNPMFAHSERSSNVEYGANPSVLTSNLSSLAHRAADIPNWQKIYATDQLLDRLSKGEPTELILTVQMPTQGASKLDSPDAVEFPQRLSTEARRAKDAAFSGLRWYRSESAKVGANRVDGIQVLTDYSHLPQIALSVSSADALNALLAIPSVLTAHENRTTRVALVQSLPLINVPVNGQLGNVSLGQGYSVAVLDTGVDYISKPGFGDCSAGVGMGTCRVAHAADFAPDDSSYDDDGHGTNVAAIILGVSPSAKVLALDVFRDGGQTASYSDILSAINWVASNVATYNIAALNLSLGDDAHWTTAATSSVYAPSFLTLRQLGVAVVVASGNRGFVNGQFTPGISTEAATPNATSVGAVYDESKLHLWPPVWGNSPNRCDDGFEWVVDEVACFSQTSALLSVVAPGAMIKAATIEDGGTSQAAPHVAGVIVALRSLFPTETIGQIISRATLRGPSVVDGRDSTIIKHRVDLRAAAANTLTVSSYLDGNRSSNVTISSSAAPRLTSEGPDLASPWSFSTSASSNVFRWFSYGQSVVLTAPASDANGGIFAGWFGGCDSVDVGTRQCTVGMIVEKGVEARYLSLTPPPQGTSYPITVNRIGVGTVTGGSGAINCGAACTVSVSASANISLTATPQTGNLFTSWTNCPSSNANVCSFNATMPRTVTASFEPIVTLTVAKIGTGLVTSALGAINCGADCSAVLASGTSVTLTASNVSGSGYTFSGWSNCPVTPSGATCGPFVISSDKSVTATFAPAAAQCVFGASPAPTTVAVGSGGTGYSVTLSSAVGCAVTITNSNTSACVTNVAPTMPGTGSTVLSIVVNATTSARSCSIGVNGLSGSFVFNQSAPSATTYTITRQVATNGSVGNASGGLVTSPACSGASGSTCTVTAAANGGYAFSGWTENGTTVSTNASYSFTVTSNRTLTANFVTSVSYVNYVLDINGPPEARMRISPSAPNWMQDNSPFEVTVALQVGTPQTATCSRVPNWTLTSFYNGAGQFTPVTSPPGLVQCNYTQTTPYLNPPQTLATSARFAAGGYNSVARMPDGSVLAWGLAQFGGIGDGGGGNSAAPALKPVQSVGVQGAAGVFVSRGNDLTLRAILADGRVFAWGNGYLGTGLTGSASTFVPTHAVAYGTNNQTLTDPNGYQILKSTGQATRFDTASGALVAYPTPDNAVALASTYGGTHALDREGRVWSLTYGSTGTSAAALATGVSAYSANNYPINGNAVYSIANNTEMLPTPLPTLTSVTALAATNNATLALKSDGTVWVWGYSVNPYQLGGATYPRGYPDLYDPAQVPGLPTIKAIAGGADFILALDTSGTVWSWGNNSKGQLGRAAGATSAAAAPITGLTNVAEIAAGSTHALAMRTDGTVWSWGENTYGTLGDGTSVDRAVPVQVICPSGYTGNLNLLSGGCTAKTSNTLSIANFPANTPAGSNVVVNGVPVTLPFTADFSATSIVTLDITAPVGYAGGRWTGDKDTGAANVTQMSLTMNRDWSLTPNVYSCLLTHRNDTSQSNVSASGYSFTPTVNFLSSIAPAVLQRCSWETTSSQSWLRAIPATGTGQVATSIVVDANSTASARTGTITFNPGPYAIVYSISQLAGVADTTPNAFAFTAASQIPINTFVISNSITVAGINVAAPVSITGGGEYSVNGGAYTSGASTVNLGDIVTVRLLSSNSYSTVTSTVLTIGGVSATFSVTTVPGPVVTNGSCGAANGSVFASAPTTNLCSAGTATAVTGVGPWTWSCNGTNGGTNQSCSAQLRDDTPDFTIAFAPQLGVALNTVVTSNTQTVTGINVPSPIAVVGGTYSIGCNGTFTSSNGFINNNQTVCVRHTSAATAATDVRTQLCIGGYCADFLSTTQLASASGVCAVQPTPGKDTFFGTAFQTQGQPNWDVMFTGGWNDSYSSLVEIDVSALPSAASTQSAWLWLYVAFKGVNDPALQILRITSPWTAAGVTWTTVPATTPYAAGPTGVLQGSWYKIDITSMYKDWKNGVYPNYGVMLSPTFTTNAALHFSSSESAIASRRPKLVVQHTGGSCASPPVQASCVVDVKGNGSAAVLPDGLLMLRYLLGFRGSALTDGLNIVPPRNTSSAIESFLADNDYSAVGSTASANVDGLILLRLLQGVPDSALLTGINLPGDAVYRDAAAIRANVNARCGTSF